MPPGTDLKTLGFQNWFGKSFIEPQGFDALKFSESAPDETPSEQNRKEYYDQLTDHIWRALKTSDPVFSAKAVAFGLSAPDDIVRVCALCSAIDIFKLDSLNFLQRVTWYFGRNIKEITRQLLGIILNRAISFSYMGPPPGPSSITKPPAQPDLMLIHGTVLPTSQAARPTWSVPGTGALFNHIQKLRPHVYGKSDYFRWEGGYTDYAREVASNNLRDWLSLRNLNGIDAVAHSHGCNVLMASNTLGAKFGKIILLSCPVHWQKYSLPTAVLPNAHSIRIKYDFVIMGDRGDQRFPSGTIKETILPFWFDAHSDTTEPGVWKNQKLDRFL